MFSKKCHTKQIIVKLTLFSLIYTNKKRCGKKKIEPANVEIILKNVNDKINIFILRLSNLIYFLGED